MSYTLRLIALDRDTFRLDKREPLRGSLSTLAYLPDRQVRKDRPTPGQAIAARWAGEGGCSETGATGIDLRT